MESGIMGFGIWNQAEESGIQILLTKNPVQEPIRSCPDPVPGIRNPQLGIQSPSSTDKDWNPVPGIRNPQCGIENPRLCWGTLHEAISVSLLMYVLVLGGFRSFLIQQTTETIVMAQVIFYTFVLKGQLQNKVQGRGDRQMERGVGRLKK